MNCELLFKIAGIDINKNKNKYIFKIDGDTYVGNPLDLETSILLNDKSDKFEAIKNGITQALLGGSVIRQYSDKNLYVPNYSGKDLKVSFPEFDWGKEVPNVLLVDDINLVANKGQNTFLTKIIQQSKVDNNPKELVMYIVPKDQLRNFAYFTKALETMKQLQAFDPNDVNSIKDPEISDEEFNKIPQEEKEVLFEERKAVYKVTEKLREEVKSLNSKGKVKRNKNIEINEKINKRFSTIIEKELKFYNSVDEKISEEKRKIQNYQKKLDDLKENKDTVKNFDAKEAFYEKQLTLHNATLSNLEFKKNHTPKILITYLTYYIQRLEQSDALIGKVTQEKIINIYKDELKTLRQNHNIEPGKTIADKSINKLTTKLNEIEDSDAPDTETITSFITYLLTRFDEYNKLFDSDLLAKVQDLSYQLAGFSTKHISDNIIVNTITTWIKQNKGVIELNTLKNYFINKKLCDKDVNVSQLYLLFKQKFLDQQNTYYLIPGQFGKTIKVAKRRKSIIEQLGSTRNSKQININDDDINSLFIQMNTVYAIKPNQTEDGEDDIYRGFYIYNEGNKWFATRDPLNVYTKEELFSTREELIENVNKHFNELKLFNFIFLNLEKNLENKAVLSATDRKYKRGEIIKMLDYPAGPNNVNKEFTVEQFRNWVQNTFDKLTAIKILDTLDTPDKMGIFYTHFRNIENNFNPEESDIYLGKLNEVNQVISELATAKYKYYSVSQDTYLVGFKPQSYMYDRRNRYTRVQEINNDALLPKQFDQQTRTNVPIINWESIKHVFEQNGIKMEVLSTAELMNKEFEQAKNMRAAFVNGIIYINKDNARVEDAFHEYTHLLLGIVKSRNPSAYNNLLKQYSDRYEAKNEQAYNTLVENIKNRYESELSTKSEAEQNTIILEEMFADDYAEYLLQHNYEMHTIFDQMNDEVTNSPIFDKLTKTDLFDAASSRYDVMSLFSSEIQTAKSKIGFGIGKLTKIKVSKTILNMVQSAQQLTRDEFMSNDELEENGLYSLCE